MKTGYIKIVSIVVSIFIFPSLILGTGESRPPHYTIVVMPNLFSDVNINDASAAFKLWVNEIGKPVAQDFSLSGIVAADFESVKNNFTKDNIAVLCLSINDYFQYRDAFGLSPAFVPDYHGETAFEYLLLVRKDKKFKSFSDLKGSNIVVSTNYDPVTSLKWFNTLCLSNNVDKAKFFKKTTETPKESQMILNLFFGKIDACVVRKTTYNLMKELNSQLDKEITSLVASPPYLIAVMCFTKNIQAENHRKSFSESALNLHNTISGKQIMTLMKIDKLSPFKKELLNNYLELLELSDRLNKQKKRN